MRANLVRRTPFFYGWVIVAGAFFGAFASGGIQGFTFSVFLKPMSEDLGWTRSALTAGIAINTLVGAVVAPLFGYIVDRHGPRPIMVMAALVGGAGAILLGRIQELWQFYVIFAVVGMFGGAALGEIVTQSTVVKWFIRLRGRAVAFGSMGGAASGAILAPLISLVIVYAGWRSGWLLLAVLFFVLLLPVSFLMIRRPEDVGLVPDGAMGSDQRHGGIKANHNVEPERSWKLGEALRNRSLWTLTATMTVAGLCVSSVVVHEFSFITDRNYSTAIAAAVLSTHAAMASVGRILWGFIVERVTVRYAMSAVFFVCGLALILLLFADRTIVFFMFAVIYGLSIGGYSITSTVAFASYFGRDNIGSIRGVVSPLITGSIAIGPVLVSGSYDSLGNYSLGFGAMVALYAAAAALALLAKPPETFPGISVMVPDEGTGEPSIKA